MSRPKRIKYVKNARECVICGAKTFAIDRISGDPVCSAKCRVENVRRKRVELSRIHRNRKRSGVNLSPRRKW